VIYLASSYCKAFSCCLMEIKRSFFGEVISAFGLIVSTRGFDSRRNHFDAGDASYRSLAVHNSRITLPVRNFAGSKMTSSPPRLRKDDHTFYQSCIALADGTNHGLEFLHCAPNLVYF